ncbi:MAG TPA: class I SAM-dependent methyltransferase [Candidatus Acidoferrales bacterium]|nr:class I SAM-dependent methyltransferase [Candidatus Acidoferrales bacterium]
MPDRARARELAAEYIRKGDPLGWFEVLYREGERGRAAVPWADLEPNSSLIEFWKAHPLESAGKRALVIGCGFGDDTEQLAAWGFKTTGFDISKTAIEGTKKRYPKTQIEYVVADLFSPPPNWLLSFDFVLEIYTIQSLPFELHPKAAEAIARFVAPGGRLLVLARGRGEGETGGPGPPWPLTRAEMDGFVRAGLQEELFEDYAEPEPPWVRRFRALYRRPRPAASS